MSSQIVTPTSASPSRSSTRSRRRREVALLVEDAVVRQEPLAVDRPHLAVRADRARVVEVAVEVGEADERRDPVRRRARSRRATASPPGRTPGRSSRSSGGYAVTASSGKRTRSAPAAARLLEPREDQRPVPVQVADDRVDLCEREPHRFSTLSRKLYQPTTSAIASSASGFSTDDMSPGILRRAPSPARPAGRSSPSASSAAPARRARARGRTPCPARRRPAPAPRPPSPTASGREHAEDPGDLALDLVRHADRRRLGDRRMCDGGRLDLRRPDPLARDVQRVVGAAVQEPVAVRVDRRPVAVRPDTGEAPPVRVEDTAPGRARSRASSPGTACGRRARRPRPCRRATAPRRRARPSPSPAPARRASTP